MLRSIIYLSKENQSFNEQTLIELSEKSHKYNRVLNITGFLSYKNGIFYQYLEGEESKIKALIKKIETDERHQVFYKFYFSNVPTKIFNNWGMKCYIFNVKNHFDHDDLVRDILEVISENTAFEDRFEAELVVNLKYIRKNFYKHLQ